MKIPALLRLFAASACLASAAAHAQTIKHDFLAIDEGLNNLMRVNENNPKNNWLVHVSQPHPRDMQLEGNGLLLISHDAGYSEYEISTGHLAKEVSKYHDVSSVRRLENGNLLIVGVDFDGKKLNKGTSPVGDPTGKHVLFIEFDPAGNEVHRQAYVGDYARLARETAQGTFLVGCNTMFREADGQGNWIHEFPVDGFEHAWMALRLPNGNTLMSSGYGTTNHKEAKVRGSFMAEVAPDGKLIRKFGAADQVAPEVNPYFYAMFQILKNGDIVIANWQGHGGGHNNSGSQIIEFDPNAAIVWSWSDRNFVSSIQGVLVLDGLNTAVMNDERNGPMGPVTAAP